MPLLAPVAGIALRYILMTLAAYALLRAQAGLSHHQPAENSKRASQNAAEPIP